MQIDFDVIPQVQLEEPIAEHALTQTPSSDDWLAQ